jgi:hypothetical protein
VQHLAHLARPDEPGYTLASGYGAIEAGVLLEVGDLPHAAPGFPQLYALNWAVSTDRAALLPGKVQPRHAEEMTVRRLLWKPPRGSPPRRCRARRSPSAAARGWHQIGARTVPFGT